MRPMLAATARKVEDICYPCCGTPKLDGIRALVVGGQLLSRNFKPIRNYWIQEVCRGLPEGLDGELMVAGGFQSVTSAVMSYEGRPDFEYWIFDRIGPGGYLERVEALPVLPSFCRILQPTYLWTIDALLAFEEACLEAEYEGIVTRSAVGPYEHKRSTLRSQNMVKFKRVQDSEATVCSILEGMTNNNPIERSIFGYAKRPGGRSGHTNRGTMGSLVCRDVHNGMDVRVGSGFDDALREHIWTNQLAYIGRVLKYSYQAHGVKDAPRFPRFLGWREDMVS